MLLSRRTFSCGFTSSPTRRISLRTGWPFRICGSIWKPCLLEETLPNNFLRYNAESFYRSNRFPKRGNIYSCGNTSGNLGEREMGEARVTSPRDECLHAISSSPKLPLVFLFISKYELFFVNILLYYASAVLYRKPSVFKTSINSGWKLCRGLMKLWTLSNAAQATRRWDNCCHIYWSSLNFVKNRLPGKFMSICAI